MNWQDFITFVRSVDVVRGGQLKQHGIKGMRWGVIRKPGPDGTVSSVAGETKPASDVHVSADAERFIRTMHKGGVEMSDRELREAINRANMVDQYNKIFAPDANKELQDKVNALQLQKQYAQLQAEMNPSKLRAATKFIAAASKGGFDAYMKLNDFSGGQLNDELSIALGLKSATPGGKHRLTIPTKKKK